jgi:hypothetical protein
VLHHKMCHSGGCLDRTLIGGQPGWVKRLTRHYRVTRVMSGEMGNLVVKVNVKENVEEGPMMANTELLEAWVSSGKAIRCLVRQIWLLGCPNVFELPKIIWVRSRLPKCYSSLIMCRVRLGSSWVRQIRSQVRQMGYPGCFRVTRVGMGLPELS